MPTKKEIIDRVVGEVSSKEEAGEVVDWFSSTIEGQQHLADMLDRDAYLMENDANTGKSFSTLQSDTLFRKIDREISKKRFKRFSLRVAAVFLPLILVSLLALYINNNTSVFEGATYSEIYVPKGEDARLFFQDGTEVYVNSDTKIRYPHRFGLKNREVYLDGEAYFNVTTNSKRPFIVHAHNTTINVTGTSFNVHAYSVDETIEVVLDEGKTIFEAQKSRFSMAPGQQLEYNKITGKISVYNLSKPSNASLWKDDIIYFYDTPLADVLQVLERKFNVQFHLQTSEALNYSYTLTTKHINIDSVLTELEKIAPVKFNYKENKVYVGL